MRRVLLLICLSAFPLSALADVDPRDADTRMFPADVTYDPSIPTPARLSSRRTTT